MQKVEVPTSHELCDRSRRRRRRRRRLTRAQILEHHLEHGAQLVARLGIERGEVGVEVQVLKLLVLGDLIVCLGAGTGGEPARIWKRRRRTVD